MVVAVVELVALEHMLFVFWPLFSLVVVICCCLLLFKNILPSVETQLSVWFGFRFVFVLLFVFGLICILCEGDCQYYIDERETLKKKQRRRRT